MFNRRNNTRREFRIAKKFNILLGNETGLTLIETLIALAILGVVAVAFLSGLATASKATFIADERAIADSLVRSELEHIKSHQYINYAEPGHGDYGVVASPDNYDIEVTEVPINPETGQPLPSGEDEGIQKITVTIKHRDKSVLTIEDYKGDR